MAREDLERAIRQRDVRVIMRVMFERDRPHIRVGYKTETDLWDYKRDCPVPGFNANGEWAELAKDVLAFHNRGGGILIFGINDAYAYTGATTRLDSKLINDGIRKYLGDRIWLEYNREFIGADQRYLGVLIVPPRGPALARFQGNAPEVRGKSLFQTGDSAIRDGDSSKILRGPDADAYARQLAAPILGKVYEINEPFFRILSPDYSSFVLRRGPCEAVEAALKDPRVSIASILGIGGVGKTAIATWATLRAYERKDFGFIVSITAKDRELTSSGIHGLQPELTSFETLLDTILEVLGFPDQKALPIDERERATRLLLQGSSGLLYVDNLETVDDKRIISFLDALPLGVRAITTSRRTTVRVSVRPVDLGPLDEAELVEFVGSLRKLPGLAYVASLSQIDRVRIGNACDRIPLAIRWALSRSRTPAEALSNAESITKSGRRGEQVLEFSFRRVFEGMTAEERAVIEVLSLYQAPLSTEALLVGSGKGGLSLDPKLLDAVEQLVEDALIQRVFDPQLHDYSYTVLPITRAFVYAQLSKEPRTEREIRQRLSDWYEARDIRDDEQRLAIRESRQGRRQADAALLDLAVSAEQRGDVVSAQSLYEQALSRNPRSWQAARRFAEFQRHQKQNKGEALRLYEQAAANAPSRGPDRALIYREWGMLLRDSGSADATDRAIDCFEIALEENPGDAVAAHALATMLQRKGQYRRIIQLLEPLMSGGSKKTREVTFGILLGAYEKTGEFIKAAELRTKMQTYTAEEN